MPFPAMYYEYTFSTTGPPFIALELKPFEWDPGLVGFLQYLHFKRTKFLEPRFGHNPKYPICCYLWSQPIQYPVIHPIKKKYNFHIYNT
jgi:hypothetical protein